MLFITSTMGKILSCWLRVNTERTGKNTRTLAVTEITKNTQSKWRFLISFLCFCCCAFIPCWKELERFNTWRGFHSLFFALISVSNRVCWCRFIYPLNTYISADISTCGSYLIISSFSLSVIWNAVCLCVITAPHKHLLCSCCCRSLQMWFTGWRRSCSGVFGNSLLFLIRMKQVRSFHVHLSQLSWESSFSVSELQRQNAAETQVQR